MHEQAAAAAAGENADSERWRAEAKAAAREQCAVLDADLDSYTLVADERERARITLLLDQRRDGAGIPDDVMLRLNACTARQVRAVLAEQLPPAATLPDADLPYPRDGLPDYLLEAYALVTDLDRPVTVGPATITVGELLGEPAGERFRKSVLEKMTHPTVLADAIDARRLLWLVALTGTGYAGDWWPSAPWPSAVADLREGLAAGELDRVLHSASTDPWCPPPIDEAFWAALTDSPETLNARQARWVIDSRLDDRIPVRLVPAAHLRRAADHPRGGLHRRPTPNCATSIRHTNPPAPSRSRERDCGSEGVAPTE